MRKKIRGGDRNVSSMIYCLYLLFIIQGHRICFNFSQHAIGVKDLTGLCVTVKEKGWNQICDPIFYSLEPTNVMLEVLVLVFSNLAERNNAILGVLSVPESC